jgi:uncharacterized membrane protein YbjE (DUF340 family)
MDMLALLLILCLGALAGYGCRLNERAISGTRTATRYAIGCLLFFMGTKLARNRDLFTSDLGVLVSAVASSALLVTVYCLGFYLLGRFRRRGAAAPANVEHRAEQPQGGHALGAVTWNTACITCGWIAFAALPPGLAAAVPADQAADWILRVLLLLIGFDLGAEFHKLAFASMPLPLLLVPFVNILLSLGCGLLFSALRSLPARAGLLLYSGLGWYSLSSVLIAKHGLVLVALLAFIHNVTRELLAILTAPFAARINPYLPVYLGGATSMDVMLPFVQRYSGRAYTLVSFYSGLVCSLAVIPLIQVLLP